MPITLTVENGTGLANANAFADLATVSARLAASPFAAAWQVVDSYVQLQCIAEASAWLSRMTWDGIVSTTTQALAFPRAWMQTPDGIAISSNSVPAWLVDATARLAFFLSQQAATPYADTGLAPFTELTLPGGLKLTPSSSTPLPSDVRALIAPYVRGRGTLVRA